MKLYPLAYVVKNSEGDYETHIDYHTSEVNCRKARAHLNRLVAVKAEPTVIQILTVYPIEVGLNKAGILKMADFTAHAVREGLPWISGQMLAADTAGEEVL